jgi:hypothetical protein
MVKEPAKPRKRGPTKRRVVKKTTLVGTPDVPPGLERRRSISAPEAHMMTATSSVFMSQPRYICVPSGPPPFPCLRYGLDPNTGEYSIPPFGEPMDCAACRASR